MALPDRSVDSKPNLYIDFSTPARIPRGFSTWEIRELDQLPRRMTGLWTWDPSKVALYRSDRQQNHYNTIIRGYERGYEIARELWRKKIPVFGVQLLDYLLEHPHLIPSEWRRKAIFFWGTIYRHHSRWKIDDSLCVRCLCWDWENDRWQWRYNWIGDLWNERDFALIPANNA